MPELTVRIESSTGRTFTRKNVGFFETPRIGECVDLAGLFELPNNGFFPRVSGVIHPLSRFGDILPTIIMFEMSEISQTVMEQVRLRWDETHAWDER